jgi:hypothetical protein
VDIIKSDEVHKQQLLKLMRTAIRGKNYFLNQLQIHLKPCNKREQKTPQQKNCEVEMEAEMILRFHPY